jgi:hypothetical protein
MSKGTFKFLVIVGGVIAAAYLWTKYKIMDYFLQPKNRAEARAAQVSNNAIDTGASLANQLINQGGKAASNALSNMLDSITTNGKVGDAQGTGVVSFDTEGNTI